MRADVPRPLPPGYELVRQLGEGGFGEVVLARQVALDRLVAIKRVHAHALAAPDDLARFEREARVLASFDHPAVVRVLDYRLETDAALVMEYVPGRTLADLLRDGPLDPPAAVRVLGDVAGALAAAAARGIVHRDVKSANVFVLPDGSAKLGDFGLARMLSDPALFRTSDGSVRGTPAYMAPEAGLGEGEPDARSDAYAFAVLAYETLTGQLPFPGLDMAAALVAHWSRTAPSAADVVPGFPPAAAEALAAGLAKDPDRRPPPSALVERLAAVPAAAWPGQDPGGGSGPGLPTVPDRGRAPAPPTVRSAPPPVPALPIVRARRRTLLAVAAAAVAVIALGGAAWRWWPAASPGPLQVRSVSTALVPGDGAGACPSARYRVRAVVTTNAGQGGLAFSWELPDGRTSPADSVDVAAGQQRVDLSLSFEVTGPTPVVGAPVLVITAPSPRRVSAPPVAYTC